MKRIGIFSGSFDPVHKGHIGFALAALKNAELDEVYFAPETKPQRKAGVTHFAHRVAMLKLATKPYPQLKVLELPDKHFLPARTTARLKKQFPKDQLVLLIGSDLAYHLHTWPKVETMLRHMGLVISTRGSSEIAGMLQLANELNMPLKELHIIESPLPYVSSRQIRTAIAHGQ